LFPDELELALEVNNWPQVVAFKEQLYSYKVAAAAGVAIRMSSFT